MLFPAGSFALAAPLAILLCCTLVSASPYASPAQIFGLDKRQDDITIGNVATEDETDAEIAADGTGAMRSEQIANSKTAELTYSSPQRSIRLSFQSGHSNLLPNRLGCERC